MGPQRPTRRGRRRTACLLALGLVPAVVGAALASPDDAAPVDADLSARIEQVAASALDALPLAGMSVAVGRGGEVVHADGFGLADVAADLPATADTVYPIGSISKQFTAATVLRLAEAGRLGLDDPVTRYVPMPGFDPSPTVRQLLSHTSGLTDRQLGQVLQATSDGIGLTLGDALAHAVAPGPTSAPGVVHEYSNGGYLHAYAVVQAVTGEPYRDVAAREVLSTAEMHDSAMCEDEPPANWARGHLHQHDLWDRVVRLGRPPGLRPAGPVNSDLVNSVCATAPDLVRWARALRTGQVVSPESHRQMVAPARLADGTSVPYGLGVQHRRFGDRRAVAHGGILDGFVSMLVDFPDDDVTVALLTNTDIDERQAELLLTELLVAVLDERPESGWRPALPGETSTEHAP